MNEFNEVKIKAIKLENNKILVNWFGKCCPELTIICNETAEFTELSLKDISIFNFLKPEKEIKGIELWKVTGKFYISKAGKPCFEITNNGNETLYALKWDISKRYSMGIPEDLALKNRMETPGVPEDWTRRGTWKYLKSELKYFRKARTNGAGQGIDYLIF